MERHRLEAELGQENFCPPVERFCQGTSLPEGEIIVIIITNKSPILGGLSSSTSSQHQLLSNPSSSLVFNLCTRTSDWYMWVTSSVDYIL